MGEVGTRWSVTILITCLVFYYCIMPNKYLRTHMLNLWCFAAPFSSPILKRRTCEGSLFSVWQMKRLPQSKDNMCMPIYLSRDCCCCVADRARAIIGHRWQIQPSVEIEEDWWNFEGSEIPFLPVCQKLDISVLNPHGHPQVFLSLPNGAAWVI